MTWFSLLLQNRKALFRSFISDLHDVRTDRFLDIFRGNGRFVSASCWRHMFSFGKLYVRLWKTKNWEIKKKVLTWSKVAFWWNIPSHEKIPIFEKSPSPKNPGNFANISRIEDFSASKIPYPHPKDWGFFGDLYWGFFSWGFWGILNPRSPSPGIFFWSSPIWKIPIPKKSHAKATSGHYEFL